MFYYILCRVAGVVDHCGMWRVEETELGRGLVVEVPENVYVVRL
jgi:hypothetical protein